MGLKKLFTIKDKSDKQDTNSLKSNKSGRRESLNSFTKSITSWGQKEKEKLKRRSLGEGSSNSSISSTKRLSAPSPADSSVPLPHQLRPTRENKVTQNYGQQQQQQQQQKTVQQQLQSNTNPFVGQLESARDVNNVINVLRDSTSSEASLSTFTSAIGVEQGEKDIQYDMSHEPLDKVIPVAIKQGHSSTGTAAVMEQERQNQAFYPLTMKFDGDSNKLELSDNNRHINKDAPITPPDSAKNETHGRDDNESLYAELLAVQQQLDAVNPNNAVDIKKRLYNINQLLAKALYNGSQLEYRLKSMISTCKQNLISVKEENTAIKASNETIKTELDYTRQQHEQIKEKHKHQLMAYQDLKDQNDMIIKENQELLQQVQNLTTQLEQHIVTRENISLLLDNVDDEKKEEKEDDLQKKLERIINLLVSSQLHNKQLEDKLQTMTTQHTQELKDVEFSCKAERQALSTKDQQLESTKKKLLDLQTNLETEKDQQLALKHQELLALQTKMETDAKMLESVHQAEMQTLEQEQEQKYKESLLRLKKESEEDIGLLKETHQAEIQELQANFKQEQQQKSEEHRKLIEKLEQQYQSKMQALEIKYTKLISDVTNSIKQEQDEWQQRKAELTSRIESLEEINSNDKLKLESQTTVINELEKENTYLKNQTDILKIDASDDVQKAAQVNAKYKQDIENLEKEKKVLETQQAAMAAELAALTKSLESTKEENLGLQSKMKETQQKVFELQSSKEASDKEELNERIRVIHEQSAQSLAQAQQQHETNLLAAEKKCQQLEEQLAEMEQVSRKAAKSVIDENERLENRLRQIEESSQLAIHENEALNEEVELLSKNTNKRTIVSENQQLRNELKAMNNIRQENLNLNEMIECLQAKVKALSMEDFSSSSSSSLSCSFDGNNNNNNNNNNKDSQQDELMLMHTRAQLGLIEYLEGEDDVLLAMAKFKKQLEAEMKEFASTIGKNNIGPIPLVSDSEQMR